MENLLVVTIVALAALYLIRGIYVRLSKGQGCGCGCAGCNTIAEDEQDFTGFSH